MPAGAPHVTDKAVPNAKARPPHLFKKGQSGNPAGMPRGTRHRVTRAAETLLDGQGEALTQKAIEMALAGDATALRLCLERLLPPRKDRPVAFEMPPLAIAEDAAKAVAAILEGVARGELTPGEATALAALVGAFTSTMEAVDLERRIAALELKGEDYGQ